MSGTAGERPELSPLPGQGPSLTRVPSTRGFKYLRKLEDHFSGREPEGAGEAGPDRLRVQAPEAPGWGGGGEGQEGTAQTGGTGGRVSPAAEAEVASCSAPTGEQTHLETRGRLHGKGAEGQEPRAHTHTCAHSLTPCTGASPHKVTPNTYVYTHPHARSHSTHAHLHVHSHVHTPTRELAHTHRYTLTHTCTPHTHMYTRVQPTYTLTHCTHITHTHTHAHARTHSSLSLMGVSTWAVSRGRWQHRDLHTQDSPAPPAPAQACSWRECRASSALWPVFVSVMTASPEALSSGRQPSIWLGRGVGLQCRLSERVRTPHGLTLLRVACGSTRKRTLPGRRLHEAARRANRGVQSSCGINMYGHNTQGAAVFEESEVPPRSQR